MRYFLLDKVTEVVPGERARGVKAVTLTDDILHDHFPDYPVMPGALIVESLAQLAGFLLEVTTNRPDAPLRRALLAQIQQAKFHEMAGPGDLLQLEVTLESTLEGAAQVRGEARVGEKRIVRALLTFVMKEIPSQRVHDQRRYVYGLWTKDLNPPPPIL
jgi:3-hydroxymyristoyl/3-hydroxydecanoyl-(acyl carrier protein) dehydratase